LDEVSSFTHPTKLELPAQSILPSFCRADVSLLPVEEKIVSSSTSSSAMPTITKTTATTAQVTATTSSKGTGVAVATPTSGAVRGVGMSAGFGVLAVFGVGWILH
jgi:hypothetical protein